MSHQLNGFYVALPSKAVIPSETLRLSGAKSAFRETAFRGVLEKGTALLAHQKVASEGSAFKNLKIAARIEGVLHQNLTHSGVCQLRRCNHPT